MGSITLLNALPANADEFIVEIASALGNVYGPKAAEQYERVGERMLRRAIEHPLVDAFAHCAWDRRASGLVLGVRRKDIAQISMIHVLQRSTGQEIERELLQRAVDAYRLEGTRAILSESLILCDIDADAIHDSLGFVQTPRFLMASPLDSETLTVEEPVMSQPATEDDEAKIGALIADGYRGHGGRTIHYEVQDRSTATDFVHMAREGSYGPANRRYCRLLQVEGQPCGAIVGCEVAPDTGFVLQVVIAPFLRGQGLGSRLVRELAAEFRASGLERVALGVTAQNPARRIYQRLGFEDILSLNAYSWWRE